MAKKPVLIHLEQQTSGVTPATAPPVPDAAGLPEGQAMQSAISLAARRPSWLARLFWALLGLITGTVASVMLWEFISGLLQRMPVLGLLITVLTALFLLVLVVITVRELAAFARLRRLDDIHHAANAALAENDLTRARAVVARLDALYRHREEARLGRETLARYAPEQLDADHLLGLAEAELLAPFDALAEREVQAAARKVAATTALVPLALADVLVALTANIRMIRRIAEIYGGRSGTLGSWRLTRAVMSHLVATGAVAIGDDMLEPLIGGGLLRKLSRRFGEGLVNGALSARVGIAAMEVCRPLPFHRVARPSVSGTVRKALTGLFG